MTTVIIGLGNPGHEYAKTRHNAGRMAVELFAKQESIDDFRFRKPANAAVAQGSVEEEKVTLVLPETYMNKSGKAAAAYVKSVRAAKRCLVVRDDIDLPLGTIKMTMYGRGAGGHKGVESIMRALKTKEFAQLKIGISAATPKGAIRKPKGDEKIVKHVTGTFSSKEEAALKKSLKKGAEAIRAFTTEGVEKALLVANTR